MKYPYGMSAGNVMINANNGRDTPALSSFQARINIPPTTTKGPTISSTKYTGASRHPARHSAAIFPELGSRGLPTRKGMWLRPSFRTTRNSTSDPIHGTTDNERKDK